MNPRAATTTATKKTKLAVLVNGQGFVHFGGTWWVVSAAGKRITVKP